MSKSKNLKINCDNVATREAIADYFRMYGDQFNRYLKAYMQRLGESSDASVTVNDSGTVVDVCNIAIDKGLVLYMIEGDVKTTPYQKVATRTNYGIIENGAIAIYIRRPDHQTDDMVNVFPDLSTAVENWYKVTADDVDGVVEDALAEQEAMMKISKADDVANSSTRITK